MKSLQRSSLALLLLLALAACSDLPSAPSERERTGVVAVGEGRVALVLEFSPAWVAENLSIGPPAESGSGYFVSRMAEGRVLVYSSRPFPERIPFRLHLKDPAPGEKVQGRVLSTSTAAGESDEGAGATVVIFE